MKTIFYSMIIGIILGVMSSAIIFKFKTKYEIPKNVTGLVIDKYNRLGGVKILNNGDIKKYYFYQIIYNKIEVGDSIVNGKIIKK